MANLYLTADLVGSASGGGRVTKEESESLKELGSCDIRDRSKINVIGKEPWCWDEALDADLRRSPTPNSPYDIAHFYAGCWPTVIPNLKHNGCLITHTAAAHSIELSKREHEKLGISYNYPHLTDPVLWDRYLKGYKLADVLICPSKHSADVMRSFGCTNRIEIIPHGVDIPEKVDPLPDRFYVGYLGAYGPDKGVRYLLEAWKKLNYSDAVLILGGRDSDSPFVRDMVFKYGGGCVYCTGWVKNVSDFYNSISLYVQPSVTEGFGIEVLEAMAHGRSVICSDGVGAVDLVSSNCGRIVPKADVDCLVDAIESMRDIYDIKLFEELGDWGHYNVAPEYTWDKVRQRYIDVWRSLLG